MATGIKLIKESALDKHYLTQIDPFWQQGVFSSFLGVADKRINFAIFEQSDRKNPLIIVPGRSEGYLKYQELAYDLFHAGYSVYIIDHRGQGISQRLTEPDHKGYVESFDHYSADLHQFITSRVRISADNKPCLLAHSMGGAIAARYLQQHPDTITAAVFSSPMIAINTGGIPSAVAQFLVKTGHKVNQWLSHNPWYFIGQGAYQARAFDDNPLMHSASRYQKFIELYHDVPQLQLGGVTFHWLAEAIKVRDVIFNQLSCLKTPILVVQAGSDTIVDNQAQNEFCQRLHDIFPYSCPDGKPVVIAGARHELLFEKDLYRQQALTHTLDWFNSH